MYKKVKQYAASNGLAVEEKKGLVYGSVNGYFVAILQDPAVQARHTVQLWVREGDAVPAPAIVDYLNQCKSKFQYLQSVAYSGSKITAEFQGLGFQWGQKYVPCLDAFLKEVTAYCRDNRLVQCCASCGTQSGLSLYQVEDSEHLLCSSCYANLSERLRQSAKRKTKSGNMAGGIVGALLGSLIGVALWVVIYQLGYISAIAGAVMVICALKGYEMLGGGLSKAGVIISCVISLIMVLVAEQLCLGIEIFNVYKDYYEITFFDAFRSVPEFLQDTEIMTSVIGELVIGYLLMALGAWGTIRQALKSGSGRVDTCMVTPVTSADNVK